MSEPMANTPRQLPPEFQESISQPYFGVEVRTEWWTDGLRFFIGQTEYSTLAAAIAEAKARARSAGTLPPTKALPPIEDVEQTVIADAVKAESDTAINELVAEAVESLRQEVQAENPDANVIVELAPPRPEEQPAGPAKLEGAA